MIKALIHYPPETVGLIGDQIKKLGLLFDEVKLYAGESLPSVDAVSGLVVMGGPMSVNDAQQYPFLKSELDLIKKAIIGKKPVLGICLGAQLIARALGATVFPNKYKEVGWYPIQSLYRAETDYVFKAIPTGTTVLHWHGDTFDLPVGATHMIKSDRCQHQAFKVGKSVVGLQFHLEVTDKMVPVWCQDPLSPGYIKQAGEDIETILSETPAAVSNLAPIAENFFTRYFKSAYAV